MPPPPRTPFKGSAPPRSHFYSSSQHHHHAGTGSVSGADDVSMDCYSSAGEESCSLMLSSPPKAPRSTRAPRYAVAGSTASRLFDDENEDENESPNVDSNNKTVGGAGGGPGPSSLSDRPLFLQRAKPLDLNFELSSVDEAVRSSDNKTSAGVASSAKGSKMMMLGGGGGSMPSSTNSRHRPFPSAMTKHHRKRHAEQTMVGRDLSFDEDEEESELNLSAEDMYTSPRNSPHPSVYKSPSSYRTMDGRTVQSKNPFSPMLMEDATAASSSVTSNSSGTPGRYTAGGERVSSAAALTESLGFPVSFEPSNGGSHGGGPNGGGEGGNNGGPPSFSAPLLRHRLHKRESHLDSPTSRNSVSYHDNSFTRDGYPHKTGRFSFTGSPIKESDMCSSHSSSNNANGPALPPPPTSHKVRRITRKDDVSAASHYGGHQERENCDWRRTLEVDTNFSSSSKGDCRSPGEDGISPTDVLSFPSMMMPSSPPRHSNQPPPTPAKGKAPPTSNFYNRRAYTPVRKPTKAPLTPKPERHRRVRSFDDLDIFGGDASDTDRGGGDDDAMSLGHSSDHRPRSRRREPQSRFHSDFDVISELGKGTFGSVFKVLSRLDGCMYAVKAAHRPAKGNSDKDRMLKEVYALAALSDQADTATFHIVRYHQAWMEENRLYIQTELCTCTLSDEIKRNGINTEQRRYKFLREMLLALEFIHRNGMVHLDIKPENIFLKNDQFKLGDFGLVSKISYHQDVEEGDSRYMSLELLSGEHDDLTKSDIFSLGVTLYEICLGADKALPGSGDQWQALRASIIPFEGAAASTPHEMQALIRQMMGPAPAGRPTASILLKRPQLLSEEQKELLAEKNKVIQANLALVAQSHQLRLLTPLPPGRKTLVRANTWNGEMC